MAAGSSPHPDPDPAAYGIGPWHAIRPGFVDPLVVLLLRCIRASWIPLLILGLIVAVLTEGPDVEVSDRIDEPTELARSLLTPLVFLVLAVIIRFTIGFVATAAAFPLARQVQRRPPSGVFAVFDRMGLLAERYRVARGFAQLRWSTPVRYAAADQLGTTGRRLLLAEQGLGWSIPVLIVAFVVAVGIAA